MRVASGESMNVTLNDGETFTIDFDGSGGVLTLQ